MGHINRADIFICVETEEQAKYVIPNIKQPYYIRIDSNVPSFSKMVNDCIKDCSNDIMIFCSKKVQPTMNDINRIIELVNQGYGYVGLYRFACFGIHKKLINTIGYLDEGFIWGNYEDDDFRIRMNYADIGFYEDETVKYTPGINASGRNCDIAKLRWYSQKYTIDKENKLITKHIRDVLPNTKLQYKNDIIFKKYKDSVHVKNSGTVYCEDKLHYFKIKYDYT